MGLLLIKSQVFAYLKIEIVIKSDELDIKGYN